MRITDPLIGVFAYAPFLTVSVVGMLVRGLSPGDGLVAALAAVGTGWSALSAWRQLSLKKRHGLPIDRPFVVLLAAALVSLAVSLVALGYIVWIAGLNAAALNDINFLPIMMFATAFIGIVLLLIARQLEITAHRQT